MGVAAIRDARVGARVATRVATACPRLMDTRTATTFDERHRIANPTGAGVRREQSFFAALVRVAVIRVRVACRADAYDQSEHDDRAMVMLRSINRCAMKHGDSLVEERDFFCALESSCELASFAAGHDCHDFVHEPSHQRTSCNSRSFESPQMNGPRGLCQMARRACPKCGPEVAVARRSKAWGGDPSSTCRIRRCSFPLNSALEPAIHRQLNWRAAARRVDRLTLEQLSPVQRP